MSEKNWSFQSTRPCGARPVGHQYDYSALPVSIHAPLRGATKSAVAVKISRAVSIHAPLRGATGATVEASWPAVCFNPRAPAGRDLIAPASGEARRMFQSTRPCGARPPYSVGEAVSRQVSIHAPLRGATAAVGDYLTVYDVSIHAPLRGATYCQ